MPYAAIERPSIALGLLKACLKECRIESTILYANIWFAEEIGLHSYQFLSNASIPAYLMGEWTFSKAAFPDFQVNDSEFLDLVTQDAESSFSVKPSELKQLLAWARGKASSFIERVAQAVLALKPRIVACSSTFEQHCASLAFLRRIRELNPEIITFMGGGNCEGPMGQVTKREFPWVDYVVSGEGEDVVPALCRQLLSQGRNVNPKDLPYGVISPVNCSNSIEQKETPRASVQNLDKVPVPDYDDYFKSLQNSWISSYISPGLPVETSRGCWWGQKKHCTFCGLNGQGMTYRSKSPTRVVGEFFELSEQYKLHKFQVVDNILDLNHINTVLPVFSALTEPYTIFYETKANLKRQQIEQLAEAGVRIVQPGIENMHDAALKLLNKGNTALMNVQLLKWSRELGIRVSWNYLMDIPGELDNWYLETAEWLPLIVHLQPPVGLMRIRYDRFSPYYEQAADYGLNLLPSRVYSYVYPLSQKALTDLAYYFEEQKDLTPEKLAPLYGGHKFGKPGHKAIEHLVAQWMDLSSSKHPPGLSMVDEGERIRIIDTRTCAIQEEQTLEGLAYWAYKVCDCIRTPRELVEELRKQGFPLSWHDVQPVVEELKRRKILLELNGKLLGLAVNDSGLSFLPKSESPGGYIDLHRYQKFIQKKLLESKFLRIP
jgi:magnesium-protoporphyrin IX monomethyl ester (oxidative) cyclase